MRKKRKAKLSWKGGVWALVGVWTALGLCASARAERSPYEWTQVRLDYARQEKAANLRHFSERVHGLALQVAEDRRVAGFFNVNLEFAKAEKQGLVPDSLAATVAKLREDFNRYYIENYLSFYDILFVDKEGVVFYTLRKETDMNVNLMEGKTAESALGRCLRESPESEAFVDFQEYGPSREPAAFFVEPMRREGALIGWIVLQCAINKVNSLFAFTEDLGQTGETFLVNQDGYMLTESNFAGASTILTKRLDDRNIQAKFAEGRGHRTITDYRGRTALTSFEVMPFMGTRWLAVAKIDKDEVTSEHYALHRRYYGDKLLENLRKAPPAPSRESSLSADRRTLRVDMDEFSKAGAGERLQTFGVSTCTGFLAVCPGRFGYLAHISPRDRIYGVGGTNLLGQMAKKIKMFDIYKYERHDVAFFVVATHFDSLLNIIDKILEEDFLLSQIRVMYNGQAETAAIIYDYDENTLGVTWRTKGEDENQRFHNMEDAVDVSRIIERLINEDGEK